MATDNKYDRQLRLWGTNGQKALSSTHILLVNATACGTETLKNLVLPGIGSFHIIDDEMMPSSCSSEISSVPTFSNFFTPVTKDTMGRSRASVATEYLCELNEDVTGTHEHIPDKGLNASYPFDKLLSTQALNPQTNTPRNILVIAADVPMTTLLPLSQICQSRNIPLVAVQSYGLVGVVRLQCPYHPIIESKPDNAPPDLRLANYGGELFPSLKSLAEGVDLATCDDKEHRHVPYVILLIKALEAWRQKEGKTTCFPSTFKEKNEFKDLIKSMARNFGEEMNFQEAHSDAYLAYTCRELPDDVQTLLDSPSQNDTTNFDVLLMALREFMKENGGEPPLDGSIPDMTSTTASYISLQKVYHDKAKDDLEKFTKCVESILSLSPSPKTISAEEISLFCKNVYNLRLLSTRSILEEWNMYTTTTNGDHSTDKTQNGTTHTNNNDDEIREDLLMHLMDPADPPEHTPLLWHMTLTACELHHATHNCYPGTGTDSRPLSLSADVASVKSHLSRVVQARGLEENELIQQWLLDKEDHVTEMVRYGAAEVHNVASVVGGVAGQEVVKIVTSQYVPLDNTYVFNGIVGVGGVYRL